VLWYSLPNFRAVRLGLLSYFLLHKGSYDLFPHNQKELSNKNK
jgi:hypothetical protein